jgi:hypothetical protein
MGIEVKLKLHTCTLLSSGSRRIFDGCDLDHREPSADRVFVADEAGVYTYGLLK